MAERHGTGSRDVARWWRRAGAAILLVLLLMLLTFAWWFRATTPEARFEAEVVSFGQSPSVLNPDRGVVTVRLPDGKIAELYPRMREVGRCRVGDKITYTKGPIGLMIEGCSRPPS